MTKTRDINIEAPPQLLENHQATEKRSYQYNKLYSIIDTFAHTHFTLSSLSEPSTLTSLPRHISVSIILALVRLIILRVRYRLTLVSLGCVPDLDVPDPMLFGPTLCLRPYILPTRGAG